MRWKWTPLVIVLGIVALSGEAQFLTGEWTADIAILPALDLNSTSFVLGYTFSSWTVVSTSDFTPDGWVWQEFNLEGALGQIEIEGNLLFGPLVSDFLYSQVIWGMDLDMAELELYAALLGDSVGGYVLGGPTGGTAVKLSASLGGGVEAVCVIGFGASLPEDGFTIHHISGLEKTYATDPRPGSCCFTVAELSLFGLTFCCSTLDFKIVFSKEGLDYAMFSFANITLASLPITFDLSAKFGVNYKGVSLTSKFDFGAVCFDIYGDLEHTGGTSVNGVIIGAFGIGCEIGPCVSFYAGTEFSSSFAPEEWGLEGDEFEYFKLSICGPGCCGSEYTMDLTVYFDNTGGIFGLSRFTTEVSLPVTISFTVSFSLSYWISTGDSSLDIGWTFKF
jgi:hypothetical protein